MTGVSTTKTDKSRSSATRIWSRWSSGFVRGSVGFILVATGIGKAMDMDGFARVLATYDLLPTLGNTLTAYSLPFLELATGLGLLTRIRFRTAAWSAVLLHLIWLAIVLITLWRGLVLDNCGCFGVFWARPLTGQTVVEDTVLLAFSLLVLRQAYGRGYSKSNGSDSYDS